jgi:RES domain-containing protein
MTLWRISSYCDLAGVGAETVSARWHTAGPGKRIVYTAEHPALALVEILVNLRNMPRQLPSVFQLLKITAPEETLIERIDLARLGDGWESEQSKTQGIGDEWLGSMKSALLGVPSAPSPESTNYLLNPLHPDTRQVKIEWCRWISYDRRLIGFHESH